MQKQNNIKVDNDTLKIRVNTPSLKKIAIILGISLGVMFTLLVIANEFFKDNYLEFRSPLQSPILIKQREVKEVEVIKEVEEVVQVEEVSQIEEKPVWKTATVTAYSCGGITTEAERQMNCPNGITATGTKPRSYYTVACDRANLGKQFHLENIGIVTCEDLGGAIKGAGRFDLYLPTIQEAREFGVQQLAYREL